MFSLHSLAFRCLLSLALILGPLLGYVHGLAHIAGLNLDRSAVAVRAIERDFSPGSQHDQTACRICLASQSFGTSLANSGGFATQVVAARVESHAILPSSRVAQRVAPFDARGPPA